MVELCLNRLFLGGISETFSYLTFRNSQVIDQRFDFYVLPQTISCGSLQAN